MDNMSLPKNAAGRLIVEEILIWGFGTFLFAINIIITGLVLITVAIGLIFSGIIELIIGRKSLEEIWTEFTDGVDEVWDDIEDFWDTIFD
jgi:hypothetical protein